MKNVFKGLAVVCAAVLLVPAARAADEVPNFNKRGDSEKKFVEKVANTIVRAAHGTVKDTDVQSYKFKETKPGRTTLDMSVVYKGRVTATKYTANIKVNLDTTDNNKWEVLSIDYEDNNRLPFSKGKVADMVKEFNKASR